MGVKLMEVGFYMMKGGIFTIRGCYRSVCHHPFLACVLGALIYISRSYPFMFSLLISASPVLVCTATLLGTLLFYGQQNIPEHEKEKKTTYEAVAPKAEPSVDGNVDECVEKYSEDKRDGVDKIAVESGLLVNKLDEIRVGSDVDGGAALNKERRSFGVESENGGNWEADGELDDPAQQKKSEWNEEKVIDGDGDGDGEVMMDHYAIISKVIGELLESESENEKSGGDSSDSEVQRHKDEGDDDSSDLGSDGAESSSRDESVDDMRPMLDELHPLLDEDTARPAHMSRDGSEAASTEQSPPSSISSIESGDETEVRDSDVVDEDEDDDDDEMQGDEEDQTNPIITWTEEDQKNLMEVGSSEIERNQRLEKILRRRKNMSMVPEINLIDFENPDFQFHIPPISTGGRQNPFDLPPDSYDNSVPGSAPSVLSQRINPFDIPDDSKDGDPTERVEEFREELRQSQTRHPFFRRRAVGPSIFSPDRQERRPVNLSPFFVSEETVVEDSSGVSSVPETESVSSVESLEEQKLDEAYVHQDQELPNEQEHVEHGGQSSDDDAEPLKVGSDSVAVAPDTLRQSSEQEHVEHGGQSSDDDAEPLKVGSDSVAVAPDTLRQASEQEHVEHIGKSSDDDAEPLKVGSDSVAVAPDTLRQASEQEHVEHGGKSSDDDAEPLKVGSDSVAVAPDTLRQASEQEHVEHRGKSSDDVEPLKVGSDSVAVAPETLRQASEQEHVEHEGQSSDDDAEPLKVGSDSVAVSPNTLRQASEQEHVEHRGQSSDDVEPLKVGSDSVAVAPDTLRQASEQEHVEHGGESFDDVEPLKVGSDSVAVAPDTLRQASAEIADLSVATTLSDDVPTREPVYDTSPSAVGNNYSSSSSSSDVHAEPDKRTQGEVPSSSSHCNDEKQGDLEGEKNSPNSVEGQLQVEHSVDNGETVGAANENLDSTPRAKAVSSPFYNRAKTWFGFAPK